MPENYPAAALDFLETLPPRRSKRRQTTGLSVSALIAALLDVHSILEHGAEAKTSPLAQIMQQVKSRGTCLSFPHESRTIMVYVWMEDETFCSTALTEEEMGELQRFVAQ